MYRRSRGCSFLGAMLALLVIAAIFAVIYAVVHPTQTPAEKEAAAKVLAAKNAAMNAYVDGMKEHADQLAQKGRTYFIWSVEPTREGGQVVHTLDNNHHRGQLFVPSHTMPSDLDKFNFAEGNTYSFSLRNPVIPLTLDNYKKHSVFDWLAITLVTP